jgi:hypothetical protein
MPTSTQFVLFGVNYGNIGGRSPRTTVAELCQKWNTTLKQMQPALHILPGFRHTGNFLLTAEKECTTPVILDQLTSQTGGQFAVFTAKEFLEWLNQLKIALASAPNPPFGRRATPGVVMDLDVNGGIPRSLPQSEKRQYSSFAIPRVLGVWKYDILTADGRRLDNQRREGGWGSIALEMKKHCGGIWTARALSTPNGLAKKLRTL